MGSSHEPGTFLVSERIRYMQVELTVEEKARLMKNRYQREWARKNKDKVKASQVKHYAKKYDELVEAWERGEDDE